MDNIHVELTDKEYLALQILLYAYRRNRQRKNGLTESRCCVLPETNAALLRIEKKINP